MNTFIHLLLLTLSQLIIGTGILSLFKIRLPLLTHLALSICLGIASLSILPFVLQLFYIPLTLQNILIGLILVCILANLRFKFNWQTFLTFYKEFKISFDFYE